jgi:hypothetical protein
VIARFAELLSSIVNKDIFNAPACTPPTTAAARETDISFTIHTDTQSPPVCVSSVSNNADIVYHRTTGLSFVSLTVFFW